ncbi:hypothetical protein MOB98_20555, partial [Bacillus sp. N13C7]|nr:hypothetical protein [Bacillus sp. N13C7]
GKSLDDQRGKETKSENPFIGRPKKTFKSVEEERDYLKAHVEYLKKVIQICMGRTDFEDSTI